MALDAMSHTIVIGEPGCTHEGQWEALVDLLYIAAECGANVFKPQWTSNPDRMVERRGVPEEYRRYYGWLNFPLEWHPELREMADRKGMQYACSIYLPEDALAVSEFVDYLKISSFENRDVRLLRIAYAAMDGGDRLIVSAGMGVDPEIHAQYLHCVSAYPAQQSEMNIRAISRREFAGLSDHSRSLIAGALAVGQGARFIEAHYKSPHCSKFNPDYKVAFTPAEFKQYVQNIRDAELLLGSGLKTIQPCEAAMLKYRVAGPRSTLSTDTHCG